ncbi:MAG: DUF2808 domain-containing protein [Cyanobacteria bacterium]|jgi:hypothetical protein|nr:DUF2808 domain-containing protein [Cyanobacteria bacterium GSL.Bin1]
MWKPSFISLGLAVVGLLSIIGLSADYSLLLAQNLPKDEVGVQSQQRDRAANRRRVALVMGNADYTVGSPLKNPVNDATDIAAMFQELGFDEVITVTNAELREMESALKNFANELRAGSVGVFYYAGHGMQSQGENYLIPVDAEIQSESDIRYESLALGQVLGRMEDAGNQMNIVILDACRDNPFNRGWRSSGSRGLAEVRAEGMLIAYATAPGNVASDGEGRNGTFTGALLEGIRTPGQDVVLMMREVRRTVKRQTGGQQVPWVSTSLDNNFAFLPGADSEPSLPQPSSPTPSATPSRPPNRSASFAESPRLLSARPTRNTVEARGVKHYFTLALPDNAGEPLQAVQIKQQQSTENIEYELEETIAFTGEKRSSGTTIAIQDVSLDEATQTITISFTEPIAPGTTFTVGLFPTRNPRSSGVYLFNVTAVPGGKKPLALNLGVARFHFRDNDHFF